MTAILCTVRSGRAYLGADSRQSLPGEYRDDGDKIVRVGSWLFGCCGDCAVETWLRCRGPVQDDGERPEAYLLRVALEFRAFWIASVRDGDPNVSLAAVHEGRAWSVSYPVNVYEVHDTYGDGGGGGSAHAALHVARRLGVAEPDAIEMAIEAVKVWCIGVGGRVHVWQSAAGSEPERLA